MSSFNDRDLSSIAWAFARAEPRAERLFRGVAEEASDRIHEFDAVHLCFLIKAFSTATMSGGTQCALCTEVLARAAEEVKRRGIRGDLTKEETLDLAQAFSIASTHLNIFPKHRHQQLTWGV